MVAGAPDWVYALTGGAAGVLVGMAMGWLIAFFHLELKTDIILTGLAMNILAAGGTVFLMFSLTGDKGSTSTLDSAQLPAVQIPFVNNIPVLGTLLNGENGAGYNIMSYIAFLLVAAIWVFLYRMSSGRASARDGRECPTRRSRSASIFAARAIGRWWRAASVRRWAVST